ncbi:hypothetical protein BGY98DRAFT_938969 [Russula aff. rugulosa BPL654]|nr:hypothetical protein BGY98DRAFT_938969 [Russula aff. rugulosa BPL654]
MVREIGVLDTTSGGTGTGSEWYLVAPFLVAVDAVAAFSNWTFVQREVHTLCRAAEEIVVDFTGDVGGSIQQLHHSAMTWSGVVSCSRAFDSESGGRAEAWLGVMNVISDNFSQRSDFSLGII